MNSRIGGITLRVLEKGLSGDADRTFGTWRTAEERKQILAQLEDGSANVVTWVEAMAVATVMDTRKFDGDAPQDWTPVDPKKLKDIALNAKLDPGATLEDVEASADAEQLCYAVGFALAGAGIGDGWTIHRYIDDAANELGYTGTGPASDGRASEAARLEELGQAMERISDDLGVDVTRLPGLQADLNLYLGAAPEDVQFLVNLASWAQ